MDYPSKPFDILIWKVIHFNEKKCLQVLQILQCLEFKNVPNRPDIAHARRILKNPGEEGRELKKSKVGDWLAAGLSGNGIDVPVSLGNTPIA